MRTARRIGLDVWRIQHRQRSLALHGAASLMDIGHENPEAALAQARDVARLAWSDERRPGCRLRPQITPLPALAGTY